MTYLPQPAGFGSWLTGPPPRPRSVTFAVNFMYAGAALEALGAIVTVARTSAVTTAIAVRQGVTVSEAHGVAIHDTLVGVVGALIVASLWLWIARQNGAGRSWARILATVLFVLDTVLALLVLPMEHPGGVGAVLASLSWLVGLAAVICLWRRDASQYFNNVSQYLVRPRYL
jgi:ABC-type transport system involved in cytochrome bd biosynthesis fused ATPase/permease subunit